MDIIGIIAGVIVGVLLGGACIWIVLRSRIERAREQAGNQFTTDRAVAQERLQSKEQEIQRLNAELSESRSSNQALQTETAKLGNLRSELTARNDELTKTDQIKERYIQELKSRLDKLNADINGFQERLMSESEKRASSEEKAARLPGLEQSSSELQRENTSLKKQLSDVSARLEEMLKADQIQERFIQELKTKVEKLTQDYNAQQERYKSETEQRSAFEVKALRASDLERHVEELQIENGNLKKMNTELLTRLEEERKAAEKNMEILKQAQEKLTDAFGKLSKDALDSNNQSFLMLAKNQLEQFQKESQTDLENRQKGIDNLVKPI